MPASGTQQTQMTKHHDHHFLESARTEEPSLRFEAKAEIARQRPALYRAGRVKGTRELVVRPNYVLVYRVLPDAVEVLRVLHATQQWPAAKRC